MSLSVNTNVSAMQALQGLNRSARDRVVVQDRISTGQSVNHAKDDGAVYAMAQTMRAEVGGLHAIQVSLTKTKVDTDFSISSAEQISDILTQMKAMAVAAADPSMDAAGRAALNEDFLSVFKQIHPLAESSPLLTRVPILVHGSPVWRREVAVSVDQLTKIEVSQEPMGPATPNVMLFTSTTNVLTETAAVTMISEVTTSLRNVNKAIAKIASESKMVDAHIALNKKLSDTIKAGIGNLVDADMAAEVAQQKALEVKQQLGLQTLAIANSSAKSVLRLFA